MRKEYEAPELTLIGKAEEVVMGTPGDGADYGWFMGPDFEFEQD
jgi:hypothetical protein